MPKSSKGSSGPRVASLGARAKNATPEKAPTARSSEAFDRKKFEDMAFSLQIKMVLGSECPADILVWAASISDGADLEADLFPWAVALNLKAPTAALRALHSSGHNATDSPGELKTTLARFKKRFSSYENYEVEQFAEALDADAARATRAKFPDLDEYDEEDGIKLLLEQYREYEGIVMRFFLKTLAGDKDECVREAVAALPSLPVDILEALAVDSIPSVRKSVARNAKTSSAVLLLLTADTDISVADIAGKTLAKRRQ